MERQVRLEQTVIIYCLLKRPLVKKLIGFKRAPLARARGGLPKHVRVWSNEWYGSRR